MKPTDLPTALEALADWITAAAVPCTVDFNRVSIPGAFLTVGDLDAAMLGRGWISATAKIHLIAKDSGNQYALTQLMGMLQKLQESGLVPTAVEPTALDLPTAGTVPTLTVTVELE